MSAHRIGPARTARVLITVTITMVVGLSLAAMPAYAHARLTDSHPHDRATVTRLPPAVMLNFNENVSGPASVAIVDPHGSTIPTGQTTIVDDAVKQVVKPASATEGTYTVNYEVTSADGHQVQGKLTFTLTRSHSGKSSNATTQPTAHGATSHDQSTDPDGAPNMNWPTLGLFLGLAAALMVIIAGIGRVVRRESGGRP